MEDINLERNETTCLEKSINSDKKRFFIHQRKYLYMKIFPKLNNLYKFNIQYD